MSRTIEMREGNLPKIDRTNVYGDRNTLNVPLSVSIDRAAGHEITHSALQGFVGKEGLVTPHTEDDGVTEIYFPLSGTFLAQRDGEIVTLRGTHADLKEIDMKGQLTISDDLQTATLTITNKDGNEEIITGFVIPSGTQHETKLQQINGEVCRYVAVKGRTSETAQNLPERIKELHEAQTYRPVAMSLIFNDRGEVLVVQSAKADVPGQGEWYLPQGGVEKSESNNVSETIKRELHEELGIGENDIKVGEFLGSEAIDAPANRAKKRGFSKGKKYFGFIVKYIGNGDLQLQESEIADAKWVSPEEAKQLMKDTRGEKRDMMFAMLDKAVTLRSQANFTD